MNSGAAVGMAFAPRNDNARETPCTDDPDLCAGHVVQERKGYSGTAGRCSERPTNEMNVLSKGHSVRSNYQQYELLFNDFVGTALDHLCCSHFHPSNFAIREADFYPVANPVNNLHLHAPVQHKRVAALRIG